MADPPTTDQAPAHRPTPRRGAPAGRGLRPVVILIILGAAGCAGAAAMTWWTVDYDDPLVGPLTLTATGADWRPELVPVALVALAGLGAILATRGWLRRAVGALLLAGGLLVAVRSVTALTAEPAALAARLTRPATLVAGPDLHLLGPLLAAAGGVLLAVAGGLVVAGAGARRGLGSRFDSPTRRTASHPPASHPTASQPTASHETAAQAQPAANGTNRPADRTSDTRGAAASVEDWWKAMDAGTDPTVPDPTRPTDPPVPVEPTGSEEPPAGGYHDHSERAS